MDTHSHSSAEKFDPIESVFADCMKRGDDFMKIEIFRLAKTWYNRALEIKPDDEQAHTKLDNCQEKLSKESRSILIIVAIMALAALLIILF